MALALQKSALGFVPNFLRTRLDRASLVGANLSRANAKFASFVNADLADALLIDAQLQGALLTGANLFRADLRGANVEDADFTGANLAGADLSTTMNLTQQQIEKAFGDQNTGLPIGLISPTHWLADVLSESKAAIAWRDWITSPVEQSL